MESQKSLIVPHKDLLITGATGNLGGKIAQFLILEGGSLKLVGRNEAKLKQFQGKAKIVPGNLEDINIIKALLKNTQAVFLVLPELRKTTIKDYASLLIGIAEDSGVSHIVNISNCTLARWGKPTPLLEFETYLNETRSIHIKHLRCANFLENLNWGLHTPYKADIKLPYISSYEVAYIAANYLKYLDFTGISVDELMGKEDYSMNDFAKKLGVPYIQTEPTEEHASFFNAFNKGHYPLVNRTENNTSRMDNEVFSLDYFLQNDFDKKLLSI